MSMNRSAQRYDNAMIILHWVIGIGILSIAGIELIRQEFPKGHFIREGLKAIHQPAGTVIFGLILVRLMWRMTLARVPGTETKSSAAAVAAKLVHVALYVMMVALPLLGLLYVFGNDKNVSFGLFSLGLPLKAAIGDYARSMRSVHETMGIAIAVLGLAHAAAALLHHYVLKDGLLTQMRIGREPRETIVAAE